jgi:hypothetical protein
LKIANWDQSISQVRETLEANPKIRGIASQLPNKYRNRRGLMIVDVIASRQRKYDSYVVPTILPMYEANAKDLSISYLSSNSPNYLPLRSGEAETMSKIARYLSDFGHINNLTSDEILCAKWAENSLIANQLLDIKGVGPALLQYLRMLSGADTLKVDVRVLDGLALIGIPISWFTADGILEISKEIAAEVGCSLVELDQILWHIIGAKK